MAALALAGQAHAHSGGTRGLSERELQAVEADMLGPAHADEHAALRKVYRRDKREGTMPRPARGKARTAVAVDPSVGGAWDAPRQVLLDGVNQGVMGINAALLPTGKVLWYSYPVEPGKATPQNEASAVLFDPATGQFQRKDPPGRANIWCSGTSLLADGRVLVAGGNLDYVRGSTTFKGLKDVYTFDPFTERWERHEDMEHGRWYPSQLLLPDGRTLIVQGFDEDGDYTNKDNLDLEIFDPSRPLGQEISKLGTLPSWAHGDFYPHMFWMPSGRALVAGPDPKDSWYIPLDRAPTQATDDIPNPALRRTWGTGVLVPDQPNQIMQIGGSDTARDYENSPATRTAETYTEGGAWQPAGSLNVGRSHHNTVLLPDGSMVTVGGGVGSNAADNRLWSFTADQRQVELWDPVSRQWRLGAAQAEGRAYHSTAVLLPDGSVVSAGDDRNGGYDRDSYEIYKPPYFFKGERPVVTSAPPEAGYGRRIWVGTPDTDIVRAALVAPGAATHAVDMNQRHVPLTVRRRADGAGYDLDMPAGVDLAPPGYYMLFLVDAQGRPSVATWVRLHPNAPHQPEPPAQPGPGGGGTTPPSGGGGTTPGSGGAVLGATKDTAAPRVRLRLLDKSRRKVRRRERIRVAVTLDEPGEIAVKGRRLTRRRRGLDVPDAERRVVRLRLTSSGRRRLRGSRRHVVTIRVVARDAAGNRTRRDFRRGLR